MLDTLRPISTPEGIELTLRLAGPAPRAVAWVIDLFLRLIALGLLSLVLMPLGGLGTGLWLMTWFFLEWLFPAVCEVRFDGATPGKKMMGLEVVHDDGTPVGWNAALTRNLLRAVDFLPLLYGMGLMSMLINRDFKRLGDLVAGTLVVYRAAPRRTTGIAKAPPLAPPVALALADQRAVLDFCERAASLTAERAEELAEIATPLVGNAHGAPALTRMMQIANYLLGRTAR
jgi:uncharacterized RDD family membrane protein YckC